MRNAVAVAVTTLLCHGSVAAQTSEADALVLAPPNWNKYGQPDLSCTSGYLDFNAASHPDFFLCHISLVLGTGSSVDPNSSEQTIPPGFTMRVLSKDAVNVRLKDIDTSVSQVKTDMQAEVEARKKALVDATAQPVQLANSERDLIVRATTEAVLKELRDKGIIP